MEIGLITLAIILATLLGWLLKQSFNTQPWVAEEVSATAHEARLLDMSGKEVHRWSVDPTVISRGWAATGQPLTDVAAIYWRRAKPLPDGSLLVLFENSRLTPYASGMLKLDWDSNVVWMAPRHYHHSIDIGPDGKIYTLYQYVEETPPEFASFMHAPFLNEGIAVLDSSGNELRRWGVLEAFAGTVYESHLKQLETAPSGDPLHLNRVQYLTADTASKLPFAMEGDLVVSIRNLNTVAIISHKTEKVVWAASGLWHRQHEPVFTPHGTMLIFDNLGAVKGSRALEVNPMTGDVIWNYAGTSDLTLDSSKYSTISWLPNGNRLVSSTYGARALEVTPENETVWEWRSDRRLGDEQQNVGHLMEMVRVPLDFFTHRAGQVARSDRNVE